METLLLAVFTLLILAGFSFKVYTAYAPDLRRASKGQGQRLRIPSGKRWYLPWLGETLDLLFSDTDEFLRRHTDRYGETFSTHVFGGPAVVSTSKDALGFFLTTPPAHHALRALYSNEILGRDSVSMVPAVPRHTALRKLLQSRMLAPEALRSFCPAVSEIAQSYFASWGDASTVFAQAEAIKFAFHVILKFACGMDPSSCTPERIDELMRWFVDMENGLMSLPIDLPGTSLRKSYIARKKVNQFAEKLIEEHWRVSQSDGLTALLQATIVDGSHDTDARKLRDGEVLDNLVLLLFAGHRAPGIHLTWVIKLLAQHPHILHQVQAEQGAIAKKMQLEGRHLLIWEDVKKMELTWRVVQETMRFTSPTAFAMRKARKDFSFQGMLVPKGWKLLVFWRSVHMNPDVHPNPKVFDPSRFEKPMESHAFTPFGLGPRGCPGGEFAKLELLVFLHHFVTTYTWQLVYPDEKTQQWPMACPSMGLPITLLPRAKLSG